MAWPKGFLTQRGAAPHVNEYTSIHHQPQNPIIPQCLVRWLFSRYQINALWNQVDSDSPPLDDIRSADHIYRLGGLRNRFCNPGAVAPGCVN